MKSVLWVYSRKAWKEYVLPSSDEDLKIRLSKDYFGLRKSEIITLKQECGRWKFTKDICGKVRKGKDDYKECTLNDGDILNFKTVHRELIIIIYRETEVFPHSFDKFELKGNENITFGSNEKNHIVFDYLGIVSDIHGEIKCLPSGHILVNHSLNGIYVNGYRTEKKELQFGDRIHASGLQMVYLGHILAIDRQDMGIPVNVNNLRFYVSSQETKSRVIKTKKEKSFYRRAPHIVDDIPKSVIDILSEKEYFSLKYPVERFALFLLKEKRVKMYDTYLEQKREEIDKAKEEIRKAYEQQYPSAKECLSYQDENKKLWNRYPKQADFLKYRIGLGDNLDDIVIKNAQCLSCDKKKDMPILYDLRNNSIIGLSGGKGAMAIARMLIAQIASNNCYTEVKMAFFYHGCEDMEEAFSFAGWLPHVWHSNRKIRYIASNKNDAELIIQDLERKIEQRKNAGVSEFPHYVIFVQDISLIEGTNLEQYILEKNSGMTAVFIAEKKTDLPYYCECIFENSQYAQEIRTIKNGKRVKEEILFDNISKESLETFAKDICGVRIKESEWESELPEETDLFDIYGIEEASQLSVREMWEKNDPGNGMRVVLGKKTSNKLFYLDFHEKGQGPHGLIGGTTGSGKSILLETMILSLAMQFNPKEVVFFLIDYKGGGMGNVFGELPHVVGQISNLSGNEIRRALLFIKSENERRQILLSTAKVNHIDDYRKFYKAGKVTEPMPHFFIIIDEFARMKVETPDFIQELITISQTGRSLGMHLVLSTQKPGGTVDDSIWSNSNFRICFRVQSKQDSYEMLHKYDAINLREPGRAYLQVGNDELFEVFQTGYGTASANQKKKKKAALLTKTGQPKYSFISHGQKKQITQAEAIKKVIIRTAREMGYEKSRNIWLPELPKIIYQEELYRLMKKKDQRGVPIGLVDNPFIQEQYPVTIDFISCGNIAVCGSIGSGKSTMLQAMLYGLTNNYSVDEVNVFCLDFGNGMMRSFEKASCVVDVFDGNYTEKIEEFFINIEKELEKRRKILRGGSFIQYNEITREKMPSIVIFIDNYGEFRQETDDDYEEAMIRLTREGVGCGIYFVISGNGYSRTDISRKVGEHMGKTFSLYFPDKYTYGELFHVSYIDILPERDIPGRGLLMDHGRILEFQTALPFPSTNDYARLKKIEKYYENGEKDA